LYLFFDSKQHPLFSQTGAGKEFICSQQNRQVLIKKGYGSKKQGRDRAAHGRPALPLIPNLNPNS